MKKILIALVAVTFLAGPAFAAEAEKKSPGQEQAEKQRLEEIHAAKAAKKKTKKAKKDKTNSTKPESPKSDSMAPPASK
jgi:Ni/Co efflux regulator RcnB